VEISLIRLKKKLIQSSFLFFFNFFLKIFVYSITVSSINELNSYNIERIISIKGEYDQQIRALETIYAKLCQAYESDNARAWNYSSQYYQQQQQQLMQHFAQQAAMMAAAGSGQPLLTTHYPQQAQSIVHQTQTNNSNGSSSKYAEQQANTNAVYPPSYYVRYCMNSIH